MSNQGVREALEKIRKMPKKQKRAVRRRIEQTMKPGSRLGQQRNAAITADAEKAPTRQKRIEKLVANYRRVTKGDKAAKKRGFVSDG
jgi:hypothetical protein